jgi:hypothetical protein
VEFKVEVQVQVQLEAQNFDFQIFESWFWSCNSVFKF